MYEKKYYISFVRMYLFLCIVGEIISVFLTLLRPRWDTFIVWSLVSIISMLFAMPIIVKMVTVKVNEDGLFIKDSDSRTVVERFVKMG